MRRPPRFLAAALLAASCASSPSSVAPSAPPVSPADLVAAVADEAAGRNPSVAEAGLLLRTIEFRLLVGRKTTEGASATILVLDAGGSTGFETTFLQTFTLEIPSSRAARVAPVAEVAGVAEFVDAAMTSARDLARAAKEQGLPHRLERVELQATIERSASSRGGVAFTFPAPIPVAVEAGGSSQASRSNTLKLTFVAAGR